MAGEKEIRSKIASVKNMQKITSAMEKVAASKIRKAQKQMEASRPYAQRIRRVDLVFGISYEDDIAVARYDKLMECLGIPVVEPTWMRMRPPMRMMGTRRGEEGRVGRRRMAMPQR